MRRRARQLRITAARLSPPLPVVEAVSLRARPKYWRSTSVAEPPGSISATSRSRLKLRAARPRKRATTRRCGSRPSTRKRANMVRNADSTMGPLMDHSSGGTAAGSISARPRGVNVSPGSGELSKPSSSRLSGLTTVMGRACNSWRPCDVWAHSMSWGKAARRSTRNASLARSSSHGGGGSGERVRTANVRRSMRKSSGVTRPETRSSPSPATASTRISLPSPCGS